MNLTNKKQIQALKDLGCKWVTVDLRGTTEAWETEPSSDNDVGWWIGGRSERADDIEIEIEDLSDDWTKNIVEL